MLKYFLFGFLPTGLLPIFGSKFRMISQIWEREKLVNTQRIYPEDIYLKVFNVIPSYECWLFDRQEDNL